MFSLNYFWFFIAATFFLSLPLDYASSNSVGYDPTFQVIAKLLTGLFSFSLFVFVCISFAKMPSWWMTLVMVAIALFFVSPIPRLIKGDTFKFIMVIAGLILSPIFTVLAYLGMFEVI